MGDPARAPLRPVEIACVIAGVALAHAFYAHHALYPSCCDAVGYTLSAADIRAAGVLSKYVFSDLRTYGYPGFLSLLLRVADVLPVSFALLVFEVQLALYFAAALLLRHALVGVDRALAITVLCGLSLDCYALLYTPETLTESLSLTLPIFTAACWVLLRSNPARDGALLAGSLAVGYAVMVRPANVYLVPVWVVGCAIAMIRVTPAPHTMARMVAALAVMALPFVPQLVNNARHYGVATPLVVQDLGTQQQLWGIQYLKYATGMPPNPANVFYPNPLSRGDAIDPQHPMRWYAEHPLRGGATLALHVFNMTDQDLTFTYSYDLHPWYRVPLAVVNHAVVALGLLGLALTGRAVARHGTAMARDAYLMLWLLVVANAALYATTAVEMRFGIVLLAVLFPAALHAARSLVHWRPLALAACVAGVVVYVFLSLALSDWVRGQSPQIRAASAR